jgi:hypothetical protein
MAYYDIALIFYMQMMFVSHRKHTHWQSRPVRGYLHLLYVDDVRTSQEIHVLASTACYGDCFTSYPYFRILPH